MPTSAVDFERAKAYLQQCDASGHSLYQHLVHMLALAAKQPTVPSLLQLSIESKSSALHASARPVAAADANTGADAEASRTLLASVQRDSAVAAPMIATTHSAPPKSIPANIRVQDLLSLSLLLRESGLSFTDTELLSLSFTMTELCREKLLDNLNFWGVVRGMQRDYYVFETKLPLSPSTRPKTVKSRAELAGVDRSEESGRGVNECQYYVSNSITDRQFTLLPDLTTDAIIKSRHIHRLLTGWLGALIAGHPDFDYREDMLLRAQIARITHSAFVAPKGSLTSNPYDEEVLGPGELIVSDDTWEGLSVSEAQSLEAWVHTRGKISKKGRTTTFVAPEIEESEEADDDGAEAEADDEEEAAEALASLENDSVDGGEPTPTQLYAIKSSPNARHPHAVVTVKSLLWPGALSVAQHKSVVNVYVGYGTKRQLKPFVPAPMANIAEEFSAMIENEDGEPVNVLTEQEDPVLTVELNDEDGEGDENADENDEADDDAEAED